MDIKFDVKGWKKSKSLSIVIYTCKEFDEKKAVESTKDFFKINKMKTESF